MNATETAAALAANASLNVSTSAAPTGDDDALDPQFYSYRYRVVGTFFQGLVLLVGVLGNLMVVMVVKRAPSMRTPTNCYLVSLAVADCVVLLASVPNELLSYYLVGNQWLWGEAGCAGFVFCQNLGINASSLSLVAFTVERYIAICQPVRSHALCSVARAKRIIAGVWAFALAYCAPWLGLTATRPLRYRGYRDLVFCDFKLPRAYYLSYFFADLLVFYVAPLLLSCALYGLIARALFHRKVLHTQAKPNGALHYDTSAADRWKVVRMLAAVVAVFAALWLPYRGMLVYNSFATLFHKDKFMDLWFLMFAKTCVYINSAINPILYNALSGKFRRAFRRTLLCSRARGRPAGGGTSASNASASNATACSALASNQKPLSKSPSSAALPETDIPAVTFRESPPDGGGGGGIGGGVLGVVGVDVVADAAAAQAALAATHNAQQHATFDQTEL